MPSANVSVERLRELFVYDEQRGALIRKVSVRNTHPVGSTVGKPDPRGRPTCVIDGRRCFVSRIVWAVVNGEHPTGFIDHMNGNVADNRIANLRDVSPQINAQNKRKSKSTSKAQLLGVRTHKRKNLYSASIIFEGHVVYAGRFTTPEAAHDFYMKLKRRLHDGYVA